MRGSRADVAARGTACSSGPRAGAGFALLRAGVLRCGLVAGLLVAAVPAGGCVERTLKITTDPPGATVILNDEEVGVSPVKVSFLWYGDYDIILRKPGYRTLKTHYTISPPWYQIPPLDLFSEVFVPVMLRDEHVLPTFTLQPAEPPPAGELVQRAIELRDRALAEPVR